jgi:secondary thiamine-phosphate synthase enzyme
MDAEFTVVSKKREELVDVTEKVEEFVSKSAKKSGICIVYTPHTTAAVTINENADPDVCADILASLNDIVKDVGFRHSEGNSAAHVKSSLLGCSQTVIVESGKLKLGTWQGIYLCEFDGPRTRRVFAKIV